MHLHKLIVIKIDKRGFSLVEVLASVLILAVVATAVLMEINFSTNMVTDNTGADAYAAEVQSAADQIMDYVNGGITAGSDIVTASKIAGVAQYRDAGTGFDPAVDLVQFEIGIDPNNSGLYQIKTREYYGPSSRRRYAEMICFAHSGW